MLKKLIVVGALAASTLAHAEVKDLQVVFKGFINERTNTFDPNGRLQAFFSVDDLNNDGNYSLDEVLSFQAGSITGPGCGEQYPVYSCLSSFSYTPGNAPTFQAEYAVHDEFFYISQSWNTGVSYSNSFSSEWGNSYYLGYRWTPETKAYVLSATAAVPEPEQYAMLGLGLAGLLAFSRRKRG
ncbi:PEP-CTERM sorting domain-containing protein [Pseudoduganella buxea]|uniref:PEP-CTERM sorting domain-containing protein n=1 Tax=Pseudoduganella buxea TaxID=1949069 RepID=A0A6I3STC8_9BURK|nr:PEP-CTERM sorting domain-containing protein [Pseudoduganella buxea]MTV51926.1 PEP-CTERM sorting domain-containing protein [Pseudoduganella buxea]GGB97266.1 hypothetical protein GCM10011572_18970 [Pseudoduganella buxea]